MNKATWCLLKMEMGVTLIRLASTQAATTLTAASKVFLRDRPKADALTFLVRILRMVSPVAGDSIR
ncbi:hypothetical protein, partial [Escherichia coli]|uniref:hypothetical protein n=1 Tax=Escherichia coli TaxID=562 RepID=UPI001BDD25F0